MHGTPSTDGSVKDQPPVRDNAGKPSRLLVGACFGGAFVLCTLFFGGLNLVAQPVVDEDRAQPHLMTERLKLVTSSGPHLVVAEIAFTQAQQRIGLMHRTEVKPDEGMLFPFNESAPHSFWMKNTIVPLDIVFIGGDHLVRNVAAMATPLSETQIPSDGPVIAVLELKGGEAAALGLKAGDRIDVDR